jgi:hypothetical protein
MELERRKFAQANALKHTRAKASSEQAARKQRQ